MRMAIHWSSFVCELSSMLHPCPSGRLVLLVLIVSLFFGLESCLQHLLRVLLGLLGHVELLIHCL